MRWAVGPFPSKKPTDGKALSVAATVQCPTHRCARRIVYRGKSRGTRAEFVKVLIVEDDRPMRELIRRVLGEAVESFIECSDGRDALAVYEAERPDWVLMDIKMKDIDGLVATQQIMTAWPRARVLIVTSYNDASLREAAQRAGASGYVLKENLLELVGILKASA